MDTVCTGRSVPAGVHLKVLHLATFLGTSSLASFLKLSLLIASITPVLCFVLYISFYFPLFPLFLMLIFACTKYFGTQCLSRFVAYFGSGASSKMTISTSRRTHSASALGLGGPKLISGGDGLLWNWVRRRRLVWLPRAQELWIVSPGSMHSAWESKLNYLAPGGTCAVRPERPLLGEMLGRFCYCMCTSLALRTYVIKQ